MDLLNKDINQCSGRVESCRVKNGTDIDLDGMAFIYGLNLPSSSKTYATKVTTTAIGIVADEMGTRSSATSHPPC